MGFFDFFRRNKQSKQIDETTNKTGNVKSDIQANTPDLTLNYRSGINADIKFGQIVDYQLQDGITKKLQKVFVTYTTPKGNFEGKEFYMEPAIMKEDGRDVYDTATYYKNLANSEKGLIKGFFEKDSVNKLATDYIGGIGKDEYGNLDRTRRFFDKTNDFYEKYKNEYIIKQKDLQRKQRQKLYEDSIREKASRHEVHIKTSHATLLTPEMYEQQFGRENNFRKELSSHSYSFEELKRRPQEPESKTTRDNQIDKNRSNLSI